ncbi:MAG: zinc ABC transporter substrate-binding protein [Bacteroides sp.]|nr:zinc ABC transporter substrate-binding protein [Bacteroides sp.]
MNRIMLLLASIAFLASCGTGGGERGEELPVLTVTIEPLRSLTEAIAADRFRVVSMVPRGSSPETYDPTPGQLVDLSRSRAYLRIGYIGFEQTWMERLEENAPHMRVFDTSEGIDLIHDSGHHHHATAEADHHHHHAHGVEPHVWNSAANARIIAGNILKALCTLDTLHRAEYVQRHDSLLRRIDRVDSLCRARLSASGTQRTFLIYHPALSYFARDYGLQQVAIETDGKEPSAATLKELVGFCRQNSVHTVFVQPEFDRRSAEAIARQTGSRVVDINPLNPDWEAEMLHIAETLASKDN